MRHAVVLIVALALALAACRSGEAVVDADAVFGHRFEHHDPDERSVLVPVEPPPGEEYFIYPAELSDIRIRQGSFEPDGRPVELVLLGAFPDACTELYEVEEEAIGRMIEVTLTMWRPKGALCARVVRPYRFYYQIGDRLEPGAYTLRVNEAVKPFVVLPAEADRR